MKKKMILFFAYIAVFSGLMQAQKIDVQQKFFATSEEDVYKLYDQMLDSARLSNRYLYPGWVERFGFGISDVIESNDTIMKIEQSCKWNRYVQRSDWKHDDEYICDRTYWLYISNSMPIDFYEHFLDYLKQQDKIEFFFIKSDINGPLYCVWQIIIKQYESKKLDKIDSLKALKLIEHTALRMINDKHDYSIFEKYDKYMTDNIRQALVKVIKNPYYPSEYLDFYMSKQDTAFLDTTGIPANISPR